MSENNKMEQQQQEHVLGVLMAQPENKVCADCGATGESKLYKVICRGYLTLLFKVLVGRLLTWEYFSV